MLSTGPRSEAMKLSCGVPETVTFVYGDTEGNIVIELYDHSSQADERPGKEFDSRAQAPGTIRPTRNRRERAERALCPDYGLLVIIGRYARR